MKILKTDTIGFCFGVERAVKAVYDILENEELRGRKIFTWGELIHNPDIINELSSKGVTSTENIDDINEGDVVVIRSHGVSSSVIDALKAKKAVVFDETCPKVKKIHKIATDSKTLIISGNIEHPEVKGIIGNCKNKFYVVKDIDELKKIVHNIYSEDEQITFVSQTTFSVEMFEEMKKFISQYKNITVENTICHSTEERQQQVRDLAQKVDMFIVVGGKNSSNTKKLFDIASQFCEAYHIESVKELPYYIKYKKIGLSSGASTPVRAVEEVIFNMISEIDNKDVIEQDVDFLEALEESLKTIRNGQRVKGIISAINGTEVQVDLGVKYSGIIPTAEFADDEAPKIGDEIEAFVVKVTDSEGTAQLSKKHLDMVKGLEKINEAYEQKTVLTGKVSEIVKGGLIIAIHGVRVFVPASQATLKKDEDLEPLKNTEVNFRIIEVDEGNGRRKRVIGSIRSVLREKRQAEIESFWNSLEEGKKYDGVVKSLTAFGAFVDIGGVDGLVHISDMTWTRVKNPAELVSVGEKVSVIVKSFDKEKKRISLTMKNPDENPWDILKANYNVDDVVEVSVVKLMPYGAFVNVIPGIDGLVHISQISKERLAKVADALTVGQKVNAKITEIDYEAQKINLSIRAAVEEVAEESAEAEEVAEESAEVEE
ncbi:MAG: bifunctional 4-hydroxy-3-methylbut-2-enyl diphosphate reductase/30S ribosomal protein S1 [Clostridia bacterium]|nr:bifunctional 4-hydroxy-3-methylbut-2-enyl diphosphate reductase/30S ribosomal protein S1 [Clostridia bacterium]